MIELRWEGDEKNQYLFAGDNPTELAWLEKRNVQWSAVIWLPGVDRGREYDTLPAHKKRIEEKVQHWFAKAAPAPEAVVCDVLTMQHSSGFPDHFTRVRVGRRELTLFMSKIKGRCEYHAAELNWLLNGADKPHILDFSDEPPEGLSEYLKSLEAAE